MKEIHQPLPKARKNQLVRKELGGEMLVYDRNSDEAHCLNATAARVWAHCDGKTTIAEMARLLEEEMKTPVADEVVWFALEQLRKSRLLQEPWTRPAQMSRRVMVRRPGNCGGSDRAFGHFDHCAHGGRRRDLSSRASWHALCEQQRLLQ
jgi:hypothetical protein